MVNEVKSLPDPLDVVLDFIGERFADFDPNDLSTETPDDGLAGRLPFATAYALPGEADRFGARWTVDLSVFDSTYRGARDKARAIENELLGYPFRVSSGGRSVLVDMVEAASPTVEVPWVADSPIRRFQGTYTISIRR